MAINGDYQRSISSGLHIIIMGTSSLLCVWFLITIVLINIEIKLKSQCLGSYLIVTVYFGNCVLRIVFVFLRLFCF